MVMRFRAYTLFTHRMVATLKLWSLFFLRLKEEANVSLTSSVLWWGYLLESCESCCFCNT